MKIATILLKYDYGIEARGESLEKKAFLPAIKSNADEVAIFWLEENGYPNDVENLQDKLLQFCEKENPDIVFFILMRDEVRVETIKKLSDKYITINWFCDDQWRFETFTKFVAPSLTYSITMDKYSLEKFKQLNCKVIHSQWATMDYQENLNTKNIKYQYDISFIGGKNITREWYVDELKKAGYKVDCFGAGWENGRISYDEMKDIFLTSKINLNLSNSIPKDIRFYKYLIQSLFKFKKLSFRAYLRKVKMTIGIILGRSGKTVEQMKARNFEICGFGGFQLSQYSPELEDYYNIGKEIAIFTNMDELKLNIDYYLNNSETREKMRIEAYIRTKLHTYENRIKKILEEVQNEKSMFSSR